MTTHTFTARLWAWRGRPDSWVFLTLPEDVSDLVEDSVVGEPRGFGSVRVRARVGGSRWETSVFPSKEEGAFVLPVKKPVRRAEGLEVGDEALVEITVVESA